MKMADLMVGHLDVLLAAKWAVRWVVRLVVYWVGLLGDLWAVWTVVLWVVYLVSESVVLKADKKVELMVC